MQNMDINKLIETVSFILNGNDGQMDYYNLIKECYIALIEVVEAIKLTKGPLFKVIWQRFDSLCVLF